MAAVSPAILHAIGYRPVPRGHVELPEYVRHQVVETWDGTKMEPIIHTRELSLSLLCGIILQSDPDQLRQ